MITGVPYLSTILSLAARTCVLPTVDILISWVWFLALLLVFSLAQSNVCFAFSLLYQLQIAVATSLCAPYCRMKFSRDYKFPISICISLAQSNVCFAFSPIYQLQIAVATSLCAPYCRMKFSRNYKLQIPDFYLYFSCIMHCPVRFYSSVENAVFH